MLAQGQLGIQSIFNYWVMWILLMLLVILWCNYYDCKYVGLKSLKLWMVKNENFTKGKVTRSLISFGAINQIEQIGRKAFLYHNLFEFINWFTAGCSFLKMKSSVISNFTIFCWITITHAVSLLYKVWNIYTVAIVIIVVRFSSRKCNLIYLFSFDNIFEFLL